MYLANPGTVCTYKPHENVVGDHGHKVHELHSVERAGPLVPGRQGLDLGLQ